MKPLKLVCFVSILLLITK